MKKFISFVMAAAMVASLVPATAFAAGEVTASAKVVDEKDYKADPNFNGVISKDEAPEVQLKVTGVDYRNTGNKELPEMEVTYGLDGAEFKNADGMLTKDEVKALLAIEGKVGKPAGSTTVKNVLDLTATKDSDIWSASALPGSTPVDEVIEGPFTTKQAALDKNVTHFKHKVTGEKIAIDTIVNKAEVLAKSVDAQIAELVAAGYIRTLVEGKLACVLYNTPGDASTGIDKVVYESSIEAIIGSPAIVADDVVKAMTAADTGTHFAIKETTLGTSQDAGYKGDARFWVEIDELDETEVVVTYHGFFQKDDLVILDLATKLTKVSEGRKATVSVDSKMVTSDDLVYASVVSKGIKASIKKTIDIAQEEVAKLDSKGLVIEPTIKGSYTADKTIMELKLSSGFEFTTKKPSISGEVVADWKVDGNTATFVTPSAEKITVDGIEIESVSAKTGSVATLKVTAKDEKSSGSYTTIGTASVEVAKVVDYKVILSVDADEDVPVIYSGVDVDNKGITDDSDHMSLEVTAEETFPGAWSMRSGFNFTLPEGVYVTNVEVTDTENFTKTPGKTPEPVVRSDWDKAFEDAYKKGDHKNFEFIKRVFDDVNTQLSDKKAMVSFKLELVADPTFEGDVKLAFNGDLVDAQEVVIAKFVKPYTAKAEQNDVIIDYRNTEIKTPITVTEAAPGLWSENAEFYLVVDRGDMIQFEDDAAFTVDEKSGMEVKDKVTSSAKDDEKGRLAYTVKEESDGSAATVTIDKIELFMQRNIPAGAYKLEIDSNMNTAYRAAALFAPDETHADSKDHKSDKDCIIDDVADYSKVVKESFVNVITSGRDQDDASFTTKIVVPVGESYLIAGESKVELEVPAYINAAGYTMLPVRAISTSLGINNNNVLWNAETKTITILYGQRIITMTVGQKTIHVNGSAIPASSAPEITKERAFLPMRDLSTALGVTDITWDQATKTATMNGNQK